MKINPKAFEGVTQGKQKFETRLYDEKRRLIKVDDIILFTQLPDLVNSVKVKVTEIITAPNFLELFKRFDPKEANWPVEFSTKKCADAMLKYYSEEEQAKWGVVAFRIELI